MDDHAFAFWQHVRRLPIPRRCVHMWITAAIESKLRESVTVGSAEEA